MDWEWDLNTCRVCLYIGTKTEKNCKSLFDILYNTTIADNLSLIANVQIEENDGLPSKICDKCLSELESAINFKSKCERSNNLLRSWDENGKVKLVTSPDTELPICIELVNNEDLFGDNIYHEIEYYDADSDAESKPETDKLDAKLDLDAKPELKIEIDVNQDSNEIPHLSPKKSKAIDLKLECHDCGGSFKSKCKLRVHWKKVHSLEKLICNFCKRTFKAYKPYHRHLKKRPSACLFGSQTRIEGIGKSRIFHCRKCYYSTKSANALKHHLYIHMGSRLYQCSFCPKSFTQYTSRETHHEYVHKILKKEITCQYCGKLIKGKQHILRHLKLHTRHTVQCDVCKKVFKSKGTLIQHLKLHSDVTYNCDVCSATFKTMHYLKVHKRKAHSEIKRQYKCDICGFTVLQSSSLKKHVIKHTNANIACGVCGRFYPGAEELASHQKRHNKEKSVCLECNRVFYNETTLRRHKIQTHRHKQNSLKREKTEIENNSPIKKKTVK